MMQQQGGNHRLGMVAAVASTVAACGLLGAFNGCTVDFWKLSQSGVGFYVGGLAGLIAGTITGALAWRRGIRIAGSSRSWLAYALLWGASASLALAASRTLWSPYNRVLFHAPLRFDRLNSVTGRFRAKLTGPHYVQIALERRGSPEKLAVFTGDSAGADRASTGRPQRPGIEWHVSGVSEREIERYWKSQDWGETVAVNVGNFDAVAGRTYDVAMTVTKPAPWAQPLNPQFQVVISPSLWSHYYVGAIVLLMSTFVASGLAVGCLFASWRTPARNRTTGATR